jgi:hypothetical protein
LSRKASFCSNHENVKTYILVILDRRITTRLLNAHLGVGKEVARQIFERHLEKRKICLKFGPHSFRPEQREHQAEYCCIFIEIVGQDHDVLQRIVTSAESWCFQFNPEMK